MGMNVGTADRISPQMNVTPLVDVVLVLLIIFMVVTPLLTKKFQLQVPKKEETTQNTPPPNEPTQLVLSLHRGGVMKVNSDVVSRAELGGKLRQLIDARKDGLVFFDADADVHYGDAVQAMDIARGSGATTITVVTAALTN